MQDSLSGPEHPIRLNIYAYYKTVDVNEKDCLNLIDKITDSLSSEIIRLKIRLWMKFIKQ